MRRAVGDNRSRQRVIATVHGRGYRFVARIKETQPAPLESEAAPARPAVTANSPSAIPDGATSSPDSDPDSGATSDFVGREDAMASLLSSLDRAAAGQGALRLIVGEPGIGKTRIAEQLTAIAVRRGFEVLVGRCYEGEGAPADWPWVQVLREAARSVEDNDRLRGFVRDGAGGFSQSYVATVAMVMIGVSQAALRTFPESIKADVIDWDEAETGERKEGSYFAAWNLADKAAGVLSVGLVGFIIQGSEGGVDPAGVRFVDRLKISISSESEMRRWESCSVDSGRRSGPGESKEEGKCPRRSENLPRFALKRTDRGDAHDS